METHMWVWLVITGHINHANIYKYIIKGGTEDEFCPLPNLLYMFKWWYFTWHNLHGSAVTNSSFAPCWKTEERYDKKALTNEHQQWTHFYVASFCYSLFRRNLPSHIWQLSLAFFCSTLTPTLTMYTISRIECKVQAHTALWIPYRSRTSHTRNYQRYWVQLAQSQVTSIIQSETQVDYTLLIFFNTAIITLRTLDNYLHTFSV